MAVPLRPEMTVRGSRKSWFLLVVVTMTRIAAAHDHQDGDMNVADGQTVTADPLVRVLLSLFQSLSLCCV